MEWYVIVLVDSINPADDGLDGYDNKRKCYVK